MRACLKRGFFLAGCAPAPAAAAPAQAPTAAGNAHTQSEQRQSGRRSVASPARLGASPMLASRNGARSDGLWQRTGGCGGSGWLPAHPMGPPWHGLGPGKEDERANPVSEHRVLCTHVKGVRPANWGGGRTRRTNRVVLVVFFYSAHRECRHRRSLRASPARLRATTLAS